MGRIKKKRERRTSQQDPRQNGCDHEEANHHEIVGNHHVDDNSRSTDCAHLRQWPFQATAGPRVT
jgi:hypothetical protein